MTVAALIYIFQIQSLKIIFGHVFDEIGVLALQKYLTFLDF